jgi:hypothetical protein
MRRATVLLTAAAAAVLVLPVQAFAAPSVLKAPDVGPVLTGATLSTDKVDVTGLDIVPVTVTVTVTDTGDDGPCSEAFGGVLLYRTSAQRWDRSATEALGGRTSCVSDSGGVRTYRAVVPVPSSAHGSWRVAGVSFGIYGDYLDPRDMGLPDATLAVTGTHRPRLRLTLTPQPLPYPRRKVTLTIQASFDDTRAPIAWQFIEVMQDSDAGCPGCSGTTDSKGRLVRTLTLTDDRWLLASLSIKAPGFDDWWPTYSIVYGLVVVQPVLWAAPAKNSARHGTNVSVNGRAGAVAVENWPDRPRIKVYLQRLVGRHWRTVSEGKIRPNGRFTLVATPPKGRNLYRVTMPDQQTFGSAKSNAFAIAGS